jgi:hypothetical protein
MARLSYPVNIDGGIEQLGLFQFYDSTSGNTYVDMETNIPFQSYGMIMIEAVGYNYGTASPVRCAWNFYNYIYTFGNTNNGSYGGLQAYSLYNSSDNYTVIKGYASNLYYLGITLNSYPTAGNGARTSVSIRRATTSTNSGNVY